MNKKELNYIKQFHGHIGPWVITGYIIGKLAKKGLNKIEKITITNPLYPPQSCLIDGIQLSTGLTIGRGEIKLVKNKNIKISLYSKKQKITIKLEKSFSGFLMGYKNRYDKKLAEYVGNTFIKFF